MMFSRFDVSSLLQDLLHSVSASRLPDVCRGLGLELSAREPMHSKRRYVEDCVALTSTEKLHKALGQVVIDFERQARQWREEGADERIAHLRAYDALRELVAPPGPRQIVFASEGKPDLVIADVTKGTLRDASGRALVLDLQIGGDGLTVRMLRAWWAALDRGGERLSNRLRQSLGSQAEREFLRAYFGIVSAAGDAADHLPALLPQVWLHYDPVTRQERLGTKVLDRQRLDFLMLAPKGRRLIFEIDGPHHIADERGRPSLAVYGEGLRADRELTLEGYTVFRFTADEVRGKEGNRMVRRFLSRLLDIDGPSAGARTHGPGND